MSGMSVGDRAGIRDRMARAEDYVLGLMNDQERERAERDLVLDPDFRGCVLELARKLQRLHARNAAMARSPDETWNDIASRLAALPQMAGTQVPMAAKRKTRRGVAARGLRTFPGPQGLTMTLGFAAILVIGWLFSRLL